jgi:predicted PurR-regulated permease PerM
MDSFSIEKVFELFAGLVAAVAGTIGGAFFMLFILAFMLFETVGLPNKMKGFADLPDHPFLERFAKFGGDIRGYVVVLTWINFLVGAADAVFLAMLGVDFPILWGLLAWFMGYIPSVGFWLALIPPFLLAFAEFGLSRALLVLIGYVLINGSIQNLVQPKLMGDKLNLSPLVIVASLFVWTWVLGPVGALVAVPMSMAVQKLILAPYDGSRWLAELMGAGPPAILGENETGADTTQG